MILPCSVKSGGGAGGGGGRAFGGGGGSGSLAEESTISRNAATVLGPAPRLCNSSTVRSSKWSVSFMRPKYFATSASLCLSSMADLMNLTRSATLTDWANAMLATQKKTHARGTFVTVSYKTVARYMI